ncbi:MAG: HAMP domain-containing histidine kinase [Chitinophagaceae bacterium]|nr:HAMP domain-containing histidine kinase [Chitinophagaceae bacterium]
MKTPLPSHDKRRQLDNRASVQDAKKRADRIINYVLGAYFIMGLLFSSIHETQQIAIVLGGVCMLLYYAYKIKMPDSDLYQYALGGILGVFTAQFIYQMHGLPVMHLFLFIGSATLIIYHNWKLQIPMVLMFMLSHGILTSFQSGIPDSTPITSLSYLDFKSLVPYFLPGIVIFVISGLWAYQLKKSSEYQLHQSVTIETLEQQAADAIVAQEQQHERQVTAVDKAVAQGKFEIASDVMHDIGNAVVGFGSYLTRIRRLQNEDSPDNLKNLANFFEKQKDGIATVFGEPKANALIKMLHGISVTQRNAQMEIAKSITEQMNIITHIQEILSIQRQYIAGHESKERNPVNLRNIINDSLAMVFSSIDKLGIAVTLNVPNDLPIIRGDRTKLMHAFLHLLKNSIDAMDSPSKENLISISARAHGDYIIVEIKDSGKGFDRETAANLFNRGFSTSKHNSGMGLYNCRSVVESHDGTIELTSEGQGKGSKATLNFKYETLAPMASEVVIHKQQNTAA